MSSFELGILISGGYLLVAAIWAGIWREVEGDWDEDQWLTLLWPVLVPVGIGWGLMWLGRTPAKLILHMRKPKLPKATVVKKVPV